MAEAGDRLRLRRDPDGRLAIIVGGIWRVGGGIPGSAEVEAALDPRPTMVRFEAAALEVWDSALVTYVASVTEMARQRQIPVNRGGLPGGVRRLIELAEAAPVRTVPGAEPPPSRLVRVGLATMGKAKSGMAALAFVGETSCAIVRMALGRARYRRRELFVLLQLGGAQAIGIVTLVAFLVGLILAFMGSVQLQHFGATIYIADLVAIGMVRELAAMMAAIVVAGRTGAAYATELGSMRMTQEIDALTTLGISPMEYLAAPRIVALTLMLPLLCLYADLMGVLGGAVIGVGLMGIAPPIYYHQTIAALKITDLFGGVAKAAVYGALVAGAGCFEGMRSGRSASAVGQAATAAVVDGIVLIIVACGLFAVLFYLLGL